MPIQEAIFVRPPPRPPMPTVPTLEKAEEQVRRHLDAAQRDALQGAQAFHGAKSPTPKEQKS